MEFKVSSRLIAHLGRELISSDEIAIYELVKNGFDAGSTSVEVNISYRIPSQILDELSKIIRDASNLAQAKQDVVNRLAEYVATADSLLQMWDLQEFQRNLEQKPKASIIDAVQALNTIEVVDTGDGMSAVEFEQHFLTIGTTHRKKQVDAMIERGADSSRPPTGEKGIGRLSSMRLGDRLEVVSQSRHSQEEIYAGIDWTHFTEDPSKLISSVPVDLEVSISSGTGKLKAAGGISGAIKESINRAFSHLKSQKNAFGMAREFDTSDFHVEAIDLLSNKVDAEIGVAFLVAAFSAIRRSPAQAGLMVLGDMSIQGNIKPVRSLVEPLQIAMDNGAKRVLIPIENKRSFFDVSAEVLENVDPIFYGEVRQAAFKALGLN